MNRVVDFVRRDPRRKAAAAGLLIACMMAAVVIPFASVGPDHPISTDTEAMVHGLGLLDVDDEDGTTALSRGDRGYVPEPIASMGADADPAADEGEGEGGGETLEPLMKLPGDKSSASADARSKPWATKMVVVPAVFDEWDYPKDSAEGDATNVPEWAMPSKKRGDAYSMGPLYQRRDPAAPNYVPNNAYETGVYLRFVLDNYDDLPDVTAFVQADFGRVENNKERLNIVAKNTKKISYQPLNVETDVKKHPAAFDPKLPTNPYNPDMSFLHSRTASELVNMWIGYKWANQDKLGDDPNRAQDAPPSLGEATGTSHLNRCWNHLASEFVPPERMPKADQDASSEEVAATGGPQLSVSLYCCSYFAVSRAQIRRVPLTTWQRLYDQLVVKGECVPGDGSPRDEIRAKFDLGISLEHMTHVMFGGKPLDAGQEARCCGPECVLRDGACDLIERGEEMPNLSNKELDALRSGSGEDASDSSSNDVGSLGSARMLALKRHRHAQLEHHTHLADIKFSRYNGKAFYAKLGRSDDLVVAELGDGNPALAKDELAKKCRAQAMRKLARGDPDTRKAADVIMTVDEVAARCVAQAAAVAKKDAAADAAMTPQQRAAKAKRIAARRAAAAKTQATADAQLKSEAELKVPRNINGKPLTPEQIANRQRNQATAALGKKHEKRNAARRAADKSSKTIKTAEDEMAAAKKEAHKSAKAVKAAEEEMAAANEKYAAAEALEQKVAAEREAAAQELQEIADSEEVKEAKENIAEVYAQMSPEDKAREDAMTPEEKEEKLKRVVERRAARKAEADEKAKAEADEKAETDDETKAEADDASSASAPAATATKPAVDPEAVAYYAARIAAKAGGSGHQITAAAMAAASKSKVASLGGGAEEASLGAADAAIDATVESIIAGYRAAALGAAANSAFEVTVDDNGNPLTVDQITDRCRNVARRKLKRGDADVVKGPDGKPLTPDEVAEGCRKRAQRREALSGRAGPEARRAVIKAEAEGIHDKDREAFLSATEEAKMFIAHEVAVNKAKASHAAYVRAAEAARIEAQNAVSALAAIEAAGGNTADSIRSASITAANAVADAQTAALAGTDQGTSDVAGKDAPYKDDGAYPDESGYPFGSATTDEEAAEDRADEEAPAPADSAADVNAEVVEDVTESGAVEDDVSDALAADAQKKMDLDEYHAERAGLGKEAKKRRSAKKQKKEPTPAEKELTPEEKRQVEARDMHADDRNEFLNFREDAIKRMEARKAVNAHPTSDAKRAEIEKLEQEALSEAAGKAMQAKAAAAAAEQVHMLTEKEIAELEDLATGKPLNGNSASAAAAAIAGSAASDVPKEGRSEIPDNANAAARNPIEDIRGDIVRAETEAAQAMFALKKESSDAVGPADVERAANAAVKALEKAHADAIKAQAKAHAEAVGAIHTNQDRAAELAKKEADLARDKLAASMTTHKNAAGEVVSPVAQSVLEARLQVGSKGANNAGHTLSPEELKDLANGQLNTEPVKPPPAPQPQEQHPSWWGKPEESLTPKELQDKHEAQARAKRMREDQKFEEEQKRAAQEEAQRHPKMNIAVDGLNVQI